MIYGEISFFCGPDDEEDEYQGEFGSDPDDETESDGNDPLETMIENIDRCDD